MSFPCTALSSFGTHIRRACQLTSLRSFIGLPTALNGLDFSEVRALTPTSSFIRSYYNGTLGSKRRLGLGSYMKQENNPMFINKSILQATDWQQIQDIVEERRGALDKVNIATAIYSLAHLGEAALGKQGQSIGAAQQFLPFLHDLSDMARSTVKDMDTQSLSNTAWACAKLGNREVQLWEAISDAAVQKRNQFSPASLSCMLWAFAYMELKPATWVQQVSKHVIGDLPSYDLQKLGTVLWSFASLKHHPGHHFLEAVRMAAESRMVPHSAICVPATVSNLLWGFAQLDHHPGIILHSSMSKTSRILNHFNAHQICAVLQALAVFDALSPSVVEMLCGRLAKVADSMNKSELYVYFQTSLLWDMKKDYSNLPEPLHLRAGQEWAKLNEVKAAKLEGSEFASQVGLVLDGIGWKYEKGWLSDDKRFLADFAVETPNGRVMVILQRQKAFCSNKPEHKLGTTNLRERVLLVHGFKVATLSEFRWGALEGEPNTQMAYLEDRVLQGHNRVW